MPCINSGTPMTGPRMRASALTLWLKPKMPPCFAGSVRREMSDVSEGIMKAKPTTTSVSAANSADAAARCRRQDHQDEAAISSTAPPVAITASRTRSRKPANEHALGDAQRDADVSECVEHFPRLEAKRAFGQLLLVAAEQQGERRFVIRKRQDENEQRQQQRAD